ncbi:DUF4974 domain-containing protein [Chitinophaga oryziterrae]|uniref:DUF4974 domain-containing protein n=1 Tax=Chitinophaga oryziterrae TaxID=1031224 RepID=A0A6N8J5B7_9BACT|nr:FecR domain-containing protein [Chitinophaga oryziterrae]MVT39861.1 DUF4974 domain-containing protein [Chitinophaga oryziterrae]
MNIAQLKEIISRYLAGKASDKETTFINEWFGRALKDAEQVPVTEYTETQRIEVLGNLHAAMNKDHKIIWLRWVGMAAAACLLLLAGYTYRFELLDITDPIPMQKVAAMKFQVKKIVLPDSSVAILNSGSEIIFPVRFRGNKRNVQLNGEAFFDIAQDPSSVFAVTAPHIQVQVLGTSFVVTDGTSIPAASVSVKTGRVAVTTDEKKTQLSANEGLVYDQLNRIVNIDKHMDVDIEWTNKQLVFNNSTLADVFREMEKLFDVKIKVAKPAIDTTKFTGAFDTGDSLDGMLKVISLSYRLTIEKSKSGTIMIR